MRPPEIAPLIDVVLAALRRAGVALHDPAVDLGLSVVGEVDLDRFPDQLLALNGD